MRAIETRYAGRHFRSRLEARWAVFFNAIGVSWFYEPEGFWLPTVKVTSERGERMEPPVKYLPDFHLPELDCYIEIKPTAPMIDEQLKMIQLVEATQRKAFVFFGQPGFHVNHGYPLGQTPGDGAHVWWPNGGWDHYQAWCICPTCGRCEIQFEGRRGRVSCHPNPERDDDRGFDDPRLITAYDAANSERFS